MREHSRRRTEFSVDSEYFLWNYDGTIGLTGRAVLLHVMGDEMARSGESVRDILKFAFELAVVELIKPLFEGGAGRGAEGNEHGSGDIRWGGHAFLFKGGNAFIKSE